MWRIGGSVAPIPAAVVGGFLALSLSSPAAAAQTTAATVTASGIAAGAVPSPGNPRSEWHIVADTVDEVEGSHVGQGHAAAVKPAATRAFWAFALLAPNAPTQAVRWNPCRTITWVWPGSTARDRYWMTRSMQAASVYSGMSFQQVGTPRADIVVRIAELASPTVGLGGARATLRRGVWRYEQGTITVDRSWRAKRPSDLKYFSLLQHELGHVIGLRHVNSLAELMYPSIHGQWKFGPGDRIGLRLLGRKSGCII